MIEYGTLVQKLNNPELQSWYFIKGIESNLRRKSTLNSYFENIRIDFNASNVDELISSLNKTEDTIKLVRTTSQPGIMKGFALAGLYSNKARIEEFLATKSRVDQILEMDDYLIDSEALIKLMGWKPL